MKTWIGFCWSMCRTLRRRAMDLQGEQRKLKAILDEITAPPWPVAVLIRVLAEAEGPRARAAIGPNRRVVRFGDGLKPDDFIWGRGALARDRNVIMAGAPAETPRCGELAVFERYVTDGRLVIRCHDEELVVEAGAALSDCKLESGDSVRFDRSSWIAYENRAAGPARRFVFRDVPDISPEMFGGQRVAVQRMLTTLTVVLHSPELATLYQLNRQASILLSGPPGCGKTLLSQIALAGVQRRKRLRCVFGVVKPAEWESPYVGETQQNIRRCFRNLCEAAGNAPAVLFIDEVESIGRIRGGMTGHHSDKFLVVLLAKARALPSACCGIALISATNRKDLIDPGPPANASRTLRSQSRVPICRGPGPYSVYICPPRFR